MTRWPLMVIYVETQQTMSRDIDIRLLVIESEPVCYVTLYITQLGIQHAVY